MKWKVSHLSEALTSSGKFSKENGFSISSRLTISGDLGHLKEGGQNRYRETLALKTVRKDGLSL